MAARERSKRILKKILSDPKLRAEMIARVVATLRQIK